MSNSSIVRTVDFCTRHAWAVVIVAVAFAAVSGAYAMRHFSVNTDVSNLISSKLPWRQRELAYQAAFPESTQSILVVMQAPTPELASASERALVEQLSNRSDVFQSVVELGGGEFFERNSLLFLSTDDLRRTTEKLTTAAPLIRTLAADPSLRGLLQALSLSLAGIQTERISLDDTSRTFDLVSETLENVLVGRPTNFSWKALWNGKPAGAEELRRLVNILAKLNYSELEPGEKATAAVRDAAERAKLASDFSANLRLTGPVRIADTEFATLREGSATNGLISAITVLLILWLALRWVRLVLAVAVTLAVGLAITAGLGLLLVGSLNPISVAFAVLFIGLGADFAIQFSVRYRAERHALPDLHRALIHAAGWVGVPLTLAATTAAVGFLSFLPTDYRGLAELGLIAGCGMGVAYIAAMTVLPALIELVKPPPERHPLGYAALAPVDQFMARHRKAVVAGTSAIALAGLPLLFGLRFDFNPLHLRNPREESVAAYLELSKDPLLGVIPAEVLAQSPDAAVAVAGRLSALPQVALTRTIDSFVPDGQDEKLPMITAAARTLDPALNARKVAPPTDAENVAALKTGAQRLNQIAGDGNGPGVQAAKRLAGDLSMLADADVDARKSIEETFVRPLTWDLDEISRVLHPQHVTRANLPQALARSWIAPDGQARAEAVPKGDPNDDQTLRQYADAVLAVEPSATGPAISTSQWGQTIVNAFIEAGVGALGAIAVLLWIALRRIGDVLLTLLPLVVAAALTLEICALTNFPLNYANIIALPVLLGVGVAFKIYYVIAWRAGQTNFLQSPLTRAVFFSALMTATAFGSLWFSSNPGMSSMGKLLALSLACTLASAALFQPALMGPPRRGPVS
jgi:hopanoid biosynthesis associated RND transporter like protein HpnN